MAGARCIPRRGRDPRRGRSPGAAARPDVRPGAGGCAGAVFVTLEIEVVEDPARACGAMLVGASLGGGHVVLTGGSTPRAAYGELVAAVKNVGLDLSDTTYWLGDERCVAPDDERANSRMIEQALLEPLADVTQPTFKRIKGELGPFDG